MSLWYLHWKIISVGEPWLESLKELGLFFLVLVFEDWFLFGAFR